ncbi:uncharacterized protein LACBIDRAFT_305846 [Laccaria bicolor S238N-H82]|uniref:Predicted protein n=1 Tax=Laccaria bicolor (strain S238N-H82 / ATCC MYA-4686) TaxID=486041 RepID=B0CS26_LACBS|nr:uncharacterized protein LACBIDRAFT_305846 [Laccaria bicolor S238N-H82]EDR14223.1 predicted protein [Laccaria bicolor S238N-H82]|eukprot:XP_001874782.1 predicted protein [Laccaria bicolor S238N-H82]
MASMFKLPPLLASFFSLFPLHTYSSIPPLNKLAVSLPTLWIHPPRDSSTPSEANLLSEDVECLKWQAYLALRGLKNIKIRSDVKAEGGIERRLPTLHVPTSESLEKNEALNISECSENGQLLPTHLIPTWVDTKLGVNFNADSLEGYKDEAARDESRAWVALLEGVVHAALILFQPTPSPLRLLLLTPNAISSNDILPAILSPPPPPLTGLSSFLPPFGTRPPRANILSQYRDAIVSLSERLGTDKWFLGSSDPTPLDALAFAYLHCLLHSHETIRIEVTRRVNLVAWEWRVRCLVRSGFTQ